MAKAQNKLMKDVLTASLGELRTQEVSMRKALFDLQFARSTKGLDDKAGVEKQKRAIARNLMRQAQLVKQGTK
jgi:ribosomal protein L29